MTTRATRLTVEQEDRGHTAHVHLEGDDVVVEWNCGDRRRFTQDLARETLRNLKLTVQDNPGVWFVGKDSDGCSFAATMIDGNLLADRQPVDNPERCAGVDWRELRQAVRQTLRQIKEPVAA